MKRYSIMVDVAKKKDFFAIVVFEANPRVVAGSPLLGNPDRTVMKYDIVYIEKARELRYPQMIERIVRITNYAQIKNDYDLLIDGTGVGDPIIDYVRDAGLFPIPIIFTGGIKVSEVYEEMGKVFANTTDRLQAARTLKEIHVPKKDLVSAGQVLMQQGRIFTAQGINYRSDIEEQLMGFIGKVNEDTKKRKGYEAETEELHDDLVVCYLMGAWWVLTGTTLEGFKEKIIPQHGGESPWEPSEYF